jgi:nucleoside diphosphate kinase
MVKIMKLEQMTLRTIYSRLVRMGVDITEEEFVVLTPREVKVLYKKAKKMYLLNCEIEKMLRGENLPEVDLTEYTEDLE